jgi:MFS family permease
MVVLADVVLALHFAYVLFVVGGLIAIWLGHALHWRWVRNWWFRVLHFAAIALVAMEAVVGVWCPLTLLEDRLRPGEEAGTSFVQRWLHALLFYDWPAWVFTALYLSFAAVVAGTFILLPPRPRSSRAMSGDHVRARHPGR